MQHPEIDEQFIAQQKERLLLEKARLEDQLSRVATKKDGDFQPNWQQVGDRADDNVLESEQFAEDIQTESDLSLVLQNVQAALERIAEGTYGFDISNNDPIPKERLMAEPSASLTLENEAKFEESLRQFTRGE